MISAARKVISLFRCMILVLPFLRIRDFLLYDVLVLINLLVIPLRTKGESILNNQFAFDNFPLTSKSIPKDIPLFSNEEFSVPGGLNILKNATKFLKGSSLVLSEVISALRTVFWF